MPASDHRHPYPAYSLLARADHWNADHSAVDHGRDGDHAIWHRPEVQAASWAAASEAADADPTERPDTDPGEAPDPTTADALRDLDDTADALNRMAAALASRTALAPLIDAHATVIRDAAAAIRRALSTARHPGIFPATATHPGCSGDHPGECDAYCDTEPRGSSAPCGQHDFSIAAPPCADCDRIAFDRARAEDAPDAHLEAAYEDAATGGYEE